MVIWAHTQTRHRAGQRSFGQVIFPYALLLAQAFLCALLGPLGACAVDLFGPFCARHQ